MTYKIDFEIAVSHRDKETREEYFYRVVEKKLLRDLFEIYCESGADPDGNDTFHCDLDMAFKSTLEAVKQLRRDYEIELNEEYV